MGSHGAHGAKEILGSNTQKVIRNAKVPVLVLKDEPAKFEVNNIVFASTFQEDVHLSFEKVIAFAELMDAQIHLLNVNMPFNFQESDEAEAKRSREDLGISDSLVRLSIGIEDPEDLKAALDKALDLI